MSLLGLNISCLQKKSNTIKPCCRAMKHDFYSEVLLHLRKLAETKTPNSRARGGAFRRLRRREARFRQSLLCLTDSRRGQFSPPQERVNVLRKALPRAETYAPLFPSFPHLFQQIFPAGIFQTFSSENILILSQFIIK